MSFFSKIGKVSQKCIFGQKIEKLAKNSFFGQKYEILINIQKMDFLGQKLGNFA